MKTGVRIGLDVFGRNLPRGLKGARVGLLVHPASVNSKLEHAVDLFVESKKLDLKALFGPQHGIREETQDNMVEWKGFRDKKRGLPVYSLYSNTRKPDSTMLEDLDVMVIDLQDAGSRYYTFIWTMELCMQACHENRKSVMILDRPNPLGGIITEGPLLDTAFSSFVGLRPLPVRHGMTIGEIGNYFRDEFYPTLDFHIIPMQGWKRSMWFDETGLSWIMPSPNMPTPDTTVVYPGMCLLEGTNISEGRGTTRPFEIFGAPFIEPEKLVKKLEESRLRGVKFRPLYFRPAFQKHANKLCGGIQIHVLNRNSFRPFRTGVAIIKSVHELYPRQFSWNSPPYEYEYENLPIDIIAGTDRLRRDIEKGELLDLMEQWWTRQCREFQRTIRRRYLIYDE